MKGVVTVGAQEGKPAPCAPTIYAVSIPRDYSNGYIRVPHGPKTRLPKYTVVLFVHMYDCSGFLLPKFYVLGPEGA